MVPTFDFYMSSYFNSSYFFYVWCHCFPVMSVFLFRFRQFSRYSNSERSEPQLRFRFCLLMALHLASWRSSWQCVEVSGLGCHHCCSRLCRCHRYVSSYLSFYLRSWYSSLADDELARCHQYILLPPYQHSIFRPFFFRPAILSLRLAPKHSDSKSPSSSLATNVDVWQYKTERKEGQEE